MNGRKILFAGTPDFALAILRALCESGVEPVAVYTQPDRPVGRGRKFRPGPVKAYAQQKKIHVCQPLTLKDRDAVAEMSQFDADLLVVAAYGLILPQAVLDLPKRGCVNVHASLLPRWRGAAPIQAAILAGDAETGISLMRMTAGVDCGPVFIQKAISIGEAEMAGELHDRLAQLGGEMICEHLPGIIAGTMPAAPQDESFATHAGKFSTSDTVLDWREPAEKLLRQVRAFNPAPGARFEFDGEQVKCWSAELVVDGGEAPGTIVAAGRDGIDVACGEGVLRMRQLQRPGRGRVNAREFADQTAPAGMRLD
jgi:methionyl-tRNA formyltransferase